MGGRGIIRSKKPTCHHTGSSSLGMALEVLTKTWVGSKGGKYYSKHVIGKKKIAPVKKAMDSW